MSDPHRVTRMPEFPGDFHIETFALRFYESIPTAGLFRYGMLGSTHGDLPRLPRKCYRGTRSDCVSLEAGDRLLANIFDHSPKQEEGRTSLLFLYYFADPRAL